MQSNVTKGCNVMDTYLRVDAVQFRKWAFLPSKHVQNYSVCQWDSMLPLGYPFIGVVPNPTLKRCHPQLFKSMPVLTSKGYAISVPNPFPLPQPFIWESLISALLHWRRAWDGCCEGLPRNEQPAGTGPIAWTVYSGINCVENCGSVHLEEGMVGSKDA